MKKALLALLTLCSIHLQAQVVTAITPNQARQGQKLSTSITSTGLFLTGSSPQGNIHDILIRNINDSVYATADSTLVTNTNLVTTFWNIPTTLTTGIYDLVVRIYNSISHTVSDYLLSTSVTINQAVLVWPGDANNDLSVNNVDLLSIGLGYGSTGPARSGASILWNGQAASDWLQSFTNYTPGLNYKYADCNGDGIINANDTTAILQNYSLTHPKTGSDSVVWRSGAPEIRAAFSKDSLHAGDTLSVTFTLGNSLTSVPNIYGIAFTYNYDAAYYDSTYTTSQFPNSWFGNNTNKISIAHTAHTAGKLSVALTRINQTNQSGNGPIGTAYFKITTDNISGLTAGTYPTAGYISDVTAIDVTGTSIPLNAVGDTAAVKYIPTGLKEVTTTLVKIMPIPAADLAMISCEDPITEIRVVSADGKEIYHRRETNSKILSLDISTYGNGLYLVQVKTTAGTGIAKLLVNK
jgi:hypothetical protein